MGFLGKIVSYVVILSVWEKEAPLGVCKYITLLCKPGKSSTSQDWTSSKDILLHPVPQESKAAKLKTKLAIWKKYLNKNSVYIFLSDCIDKLCFLKGLWIVWLFFLAIKLLIVYLDFYFVLGWLHWIRWSFCRSQTCQMPNSVADNESC